MSRGEILRPVPADARTSSRMGRFADAAQRATGRDLPDYQALWQWSVDDIDTFWSLVSADFGVRWHTTPERFLADATMPGAVWCPGGTLNYAEHSLRYTGDQPAIISRSQSRADVALSRDELRDQVARCAAGLRRLGVGKGSSVAAYLPNIAETVVAFLATASLGAAWASCAPEFGARSVIDRLGQVKPDVLFVVDGYRYGDKPVGRGDEVAQVRAAVRVRHTVLMPYMDEATAHDTVPGALDWAELLAEPGELTFEPVEFNHPLYVLFSSGTTGLPKPIVHCHGGITLEHLKWCGLHMDLGEQDRLFWFSTTGWMMWNLLVSGLLTGSTVVCFDGNPASPDLSTLWEFAAEVGVTVFGTSAPYLMACRKAGLVPNTTLDLSAIRTVGSTGAPLPVEGFHWVYDAVAADRSTFVLDSVSGGTDVCSAFVGAAPLLPVRAGELSGRFLGTRAESFDEQGNPLVGSVGELVITAPMPSMPVGLLGDDDGSRYRESYFDVYPGVWRHGDWITIYDDGACVISGRSDATLNRGGVRIGTAEFYSVVEDLAEVKESLVVHLEDSEGGSGSLILFVAADDAAADEAALAPVIARELRTKLSPRHVPDEIHLVNEIPKTLSGKKLEIPVKKLLAGAEIGAVASVDALANPASLEAFRDIAAQRRSSS